MIDTVTKLLLLCDTSESVMPPTELYNENWMLRLTLDWFSSHREIEHPLKFQPGSRWYTEGLLSSPFLPTARGDRRAESYTHADGLIGDFFIKPDERGEVTMLPDSRQLIIIEGKMGSRLSTGVKNAPGYDQAARNVACLAHVASEAVDPRHLAFYVIAPTSQIRSGVFGNLVSLENIKAKVQARVAQYGGIKDEWFSQVFLPKLKLIELGIISWGSIIEYIQDHDSIESPGLSDFYDKCCRFNRLN